VVAHVAWQSPSSLPSIYRRYARGQGAFYGKHLRRGDTFIACRALRDLVRAPWLLIRGLISRNRELLALAYGEITGLVPGIMAGLANRDGPGARRSHLRLVGSTRRWAGSCWPIRSWFRRC
jgi:hypothetical protein